MTEVDFTSDLWLFLSQSSAKMTTMSGGSLENVRISPVPVLVADGPDA